MTSAAQPSVRRRPTPGDVSPHRAGAGIVLAVAVLALGAWMALVGFRAFTPDLPHPGLDASWIAVMGEATERGWRWGPDLAFTYGPAASLVTRYGNATYLSLTLPLLVAVSLLMAACLLISAGRGAGRWPVTLLATASLGVVAAHIGRSPDAVFLVLPLLPVLLALSPGAAPRLGVGVAATAAVAVGMTGLAKMSYPLTALPLFLAVDVSLLLRRRLPPLTLPWLAGFLVADVAYGQSLADLPTFLRLQGEVVAGYSDAMALNGSKRELLAFGTASAALLVLLVLAERRGGAGRAPVALPLCLGVTLWVLLKAGFVRQDLHTLIAWNGLGFVAAALAWARLGRWRRDIGAAVLLAAMALCVVVNAEAPENYGKPLLPAVLAFERDCLVDTLIDQASAAENLMEDPAGAMSQLRDDREAAWRGVAEAVPLPRLAGSVDVIPSLQSALLASGLDYRPRPSFQEYSTYTPGLAEANRAFLEGPHPPAWVLFGREPGTSNLTINDRYPNFAEGALWPVLLRLYRPERRVGDLLALHRRATPADLRLGPPQPRTVGFDEDIPVPGAEAGAVLATVDVRPSFAGRLAGLLFRPAPLVLTVTFADHHRDSYQFISGIGRAGFVLSPLVDDADGFAALAEGAAAPPDRTVTAFSLHAPPHLAGLFDPSIAVETRGLALGTAP